VEGGRVDGGAMGGTLNEGDETKSNPEGEVVGGKEAGLHRKKGQVPIYYAGPLPQPKLLREDHDQPSYLEGQQC